MTLVGRWLLSAIFLICGVFKIVNFEAISKDMAAHGLTYTPALLVIAIIIEMIGAFSLIFGWKARWASFVLFLYLIPVTYVYHNFWSVGDALEQQTQFINFFRNAAIMGGLLLMIGNGPGGCSVDSRGCRRKSHNNLPE